MNEGKVSNANAKNYFIALLLLIVVVLLIFLITPHIVTPTPDSETEMAMMNMAGMSLKAFDIASTTSQSEIPSIDFTITKDTTDGWDIHILTTHFTFTPDKIDTAPMLGEGHVHLYVDGTLIVVLSDWYHLDELSPGTHNITAMLANNDHSVYSMNGNYIEAQKKIVQ